MASAPAKPEPSSSSPPPVAVPPQAPSPVSDDPNIHDVTSPLLGTFYRSPKPGSPPFVEVGSRVEPDTVIAIVEVMKLMNSVRAGVAGKVVAILAVDGSAVDEGQPLIRVRREG